MMYRGNRSLGCCCFNYGIDVITCKIPPKLTSSSLTNFCVSHGPFAWQLFLLHLSFWYSTAYKQLHPEIIIRVRICIKRYFYWSAVGSQDYAPARFRPSRCSCQNFSIHIFTYFSTSANINRYAHNFGFGHKLCTYIQVFSYFWAFGDFWVYRNLVMLWDPERSLFCIYLFIASRNMKNFLKWITFGGTTLLIWIRLCPFTAEMMRVWNWRNTKLISSKLSWAGSVKRPTWGLWGKLNTSSESNHVIRRIDEADTDGGGISSSSNRTHLIGHFFIRFAGNLQNFSLIIFSYLIPRCFTQIVLGLRHY